MGTVRCKQSAASIFSNERVQKECHFSPTCVCGGDGGDWDSGLRWDFGEMSVVGTCKCGECQLTNKSVK